MPMSVPHSPKSKKLQSVLHWREEIHPCLTLLHIFSGFSLATEHLRSFSGPQSHVELLPRERMEGHCVAPAEGTSQALNLERCPFWLPKCYVVFVGGTGCKKVFLFASNLGWKKHCLDFLKIAILHSWWLSKLLVLLLAASQWTRSSTIYTFWANTFPVALEHEEVRSFSNRFELLNISNIRGHHGIMQRHKIFTAISWTVKRMLICMTKNKHAPATRCLINSTRNLSSLQSLYNQKFQLSNCFEHFSPLTAWYATCYHLSEGLLPNNIISWM